MKDNFFVWGIYYVTYRMTINLGIVVIHSWSLYRAATLYHFLFDLKKTCNLKFDFNYSGDEFQIYFEIFLQKNKKQKYIPPPPLKVCKSSNSLYAFNVKQKNIKIRQKLQKKSSQPVIQLQTYEYGYMISCTELFVSFCYQGNL